MDTSLLLNILNVRPGLTVRDILPLLREHGLDVDRSTLNGALYGMLRSGLVERSESPTGGAPHWSVAKRDTGARREPLIVSQRGIRRVFDRQLRDGLHLTLLERSDGPNDPYVDVEIFDGKVVATINVLHPIWVAASLNDHTLDMIRAMAAVDALMLARTGDRDRALDRKRVVALRDTYLREIVLQSTRDEF